MTAPLTSVRIAAAILALLVATIGGAWAFQAMGISPCELCLKERLPYYVGIPVAAATLLAARRDAARPARAGFVLLGLLFLFSAGFGAYHAGVEWGWWAGPSDCTGALTRASSNADFLRQLQSVRVVRCDAAAIRILGLSLAGWNVIVSAAVAALSLTGLARAARPVSPRRAPPARAASPSRS